MPALMSGIAADTVCLLISTTAVCTIQAKLPTALNGLKRQTRHLQVKHIVCVVRKEDGSADIRLHDV